MHIIANNQLVLRTHDNHRFTALGIIKYSLSNMEDCAYGENEPLSRHVAPFNINYRRIFLSITRFTFFLSDISEGRLSAFM